MDIIPVADLGVKASWGLFAGVSSGPWGGYLSFRSNFVTTNCAYSIDSSGNILDGGKFWGNGSDRYGKWSLTGGAIWRPWSPAFGFWLGGGYAANCLAWQDIGGSWARVEDYSNNGLTVEAGLTGRWKHLSAIAGLRLQERVYAVLGIGCCF